MSFIELLLIAIGLSMDAFAVSICKGLEMPKIRYKDGFIVALTFGIFQGIMPLIGWFLGSQFKNIIESYDHWIAFILLAIIGGKMLFDGIKENDEDACDININRLKIGHVITLAIATSIDALAVGISFGFLNVKIISASITIAITTLLICIIGIFIGNKFGSKYKNKAEILGGVILILIGLKILLNHLGYIQF